MGIEQEPVEAGFLEELEEYLTLSKEQVNIFRRRNFPALFVVWSV
jgi:hypothetical protein